jgi:hypothetical protein
MNLPQFTAESSLYKSKNVYHEFGATDSMELMEMVDGGVEVQLSGIICVNYDGQIVCSSDCPVCESNQVCCKGSCTDHGTDNFNCGECGFECPRGATCDHGACYCQTGQKICGNSCSDTQTDPNNCGTCGNSCPSGSTCSNGLCVCPHGLVKCGNTCSNTSTDANNCGACGNVCSNGGTCSNGKCICPTGFTNCGNTCLNTNADSQNCGKCGNVCPQGTGCQEGKCVNTTVTPGVCNQKMYNANCLNYDPGSPENSILAIECSLFWGKCKPGWECCDGEACREIKFDYSNCGGCGQSCTGDSTCCNGQCMPYNSVVCGETCCEPGNVCCNDSCMPPGSFMCGENCCLPGYKCCDNDYCCLDGYECCNGTCCPPGFSCCGGACCPSNYPCCEGSCIQPPDQNGYNNYILGGADANDRNGLSSPNNQLVFIFEVGGAAIVGNGQFSIQFNATAQETLPSDANENAYGNVWIQYIFEIRGNSITPSLQYAFGGNQECYLNYENHCSAACNPQFTTGANAQGVQNSQFCNQGWNGPSLASSIPSNELPADYKLQLVFNTDNDGRIVGANFSVFDENNNPTVGSPQSIPAPNLWPYHMTQITTNLVCIGSGCFTSFTQGNTMGQQNSVSYQSNNSSICYTTQVDQTAENSNASFGQFKSCCSTPGSSFVQPVIIPNCNPPCKSDSQCYLVNGSSKCVKNVCSPSCKSNAQCLLVNGNLTCVPSKGG